MLRATQRMLGSCICGS